MHIHPRKKKKKHKHDAKHIENTTTTTKTPTDIGHSRHNNSPYQPSNIKHNQIATPTQSHETSENTDNQEWQSSPHKHIMNTTRQNTPLPSTEITTTNQFIPLIPFLTPENISGIVVEIHNTTPSKTYNRPTPTKGQNNITSKINLYEDITKNTPTTPDNHPQKNTKTHSSTTHTTRQDSTAHNPHKYTTTPPHQIHQPTHQINIPKTQNKRKENNTILDNLKPQTDFNVTKQQLKLSFPGKTFTIKQLKKGGIVLTPEKQEDVNAFLLHDRYNPQYFGQHIYIHLPYYSTNLTNHNPTHPTTDRPISLISHLSKILEKIITTQIYHWAETNNILHKGHQVLERTNLPQTNYSNSPKPSARQKIKEDPPRQYFLTWRKPLINYGMMASSTNFSS